MASTTRIVIFGQIVASILLLSTAVFSSGIQNVQSGDIKPKQIIYLGVIRGKAFFYDDTRNVNWTTAASNCKAADMELASIESKNETEFIAEALRARNFMGHMWTAGRISYRPSSFVWNNTGETVSSDVVEPFDLTPSSFQHCISVYVDPDGSHYDVIPCASTYNGGLCQLG